MHKCNEAKESLSMRVLNKTTDYGDHEFDNLSKNDFITGVLKSIFRRKPKLSLNAKRNL